MKKILSILLAAMLILGILPATALAADTEVVFALGANGTATHYDGTSNSSYTATVDGYTLSITGGSKMYTGARDAKGNSCIKLGANGAAGSFSISNIPDDVTSVVIHIAAYKAKTASIKINDGTAKALTNKSDNGTYDAITVDTTSISTIKVAVSSGYRAMVNSIVFVVSGGSAEPKCEHTETTAVGQAKEPSCTETGITAGVKCANPDCGEVLEEQETIAALGHNYVDGFCANPGCGKEQPDGGTATISFANTNQRVTLSEATQVWQDADGIITFANNKTAASNAIADYSNPARFYKDSQIVVSCESGYIITSITVTAAGESKHKTPWADTLGSTAVVSGDNYTVNFPDGVESFTCTATAQIRAASLSVTYATAGGSAEPVVEMGGKQYSSFEEAYAEDPDTPIKLLTNLEDITVTGDLYLDLNGFNADVDSANAVFLIDTTATNAKEGNGKLTTTSEVIVDYTANDVRYIALEDNGVYTAHVLELKLTAVTLRTTQAGIYYKAMIECDDTLRDATVQYGVVLSIDNMPGADFAIEENDVNAWTVVDGAPVKGKFFTSGSVFNIFKGEDVANDKARGEKAIYANAYLKLNDENGTILMSDLNDGATEETEGFKGISFSLLKVMERLNEQTTFDGLTEAQQNRIAQFYNDWSDVMSQWTLNYIAAKAAELAQ